MAHIKIGFVMLPWLMLLLFCGCAITNVPHGLRPGAEEAGSWPFGGWISAETDSGYVNGEFLAVDSLAIRVLRDSTFWIVSRTRISHATIVFYDANEGDAALWTLGGIIGSISHGYYLVFTAPMWLLGGTITTSELSYEPIFVYPDETWEELAKYSRFPQGLPRGATAELLRGQKGITVREKYIGSR
jgi:hypothetical protein